MISSNSSRAHHLGAWTAFALVLVATPSQADDAVASWSQYANPWQVGWSDAALDDAFELACDAGSAAVFVAVDEHALVAWGDVDRRLNAHSIRKAMLSVTFGVHVERGAIDLDATLEELDIDDEPPLTRAEKQARIVDLLRGRSGVYHPAAYETPGKRAERPTRGSHAPGTHFWSNNWDFNTLLTIFEREAEASFFEKFDRVIAAPLGMQDFRPEDGQYLYEPEHSIHPAYPLRISTRDLARLGQLVLQHGRWEGKVVITEAWMKESTRPHTIFAERGGYTGNFHAGAGFGYMWWIYPAGCHPLVTPHSINSTRSRPKAPGAISC